MKNKIKDILLSETENVDLPMSKKLLDTPIMTKEEFLNKETVNEITSFEKAFESKKVNKAKKFGLEIAISSLCMVLVALLSVFSIFTINANKASALTTYIIDINPSICITTDSDDKVVSAYSLNDDGDVLISDKSFENVSGKDFDECLKDMIKFLIENNYINFSIEKQSKKINFQVTNNKESKAMEKCKHAKEFIYNELMQKGFNDYEIQEKFLPVPEFRDKMGFDKNLKDLDEMREEILKHNKYFNPDFIPPMPPEM